VLLATENAPPGKRAWYGSFPQLGAPLGFLCSTGAFLALTEALSPEEFVEWGWRIPFLASASLVFVGLYVRLRLTETPEFARAMANNERVRAPMVTVVRRHGRTLVLGALAAAATFSIFYLMTVFTLSWAVSKLGFPRQEFLILQMIGVLFFAAMIPFAASIADRVGGRRMLMAATLGIIAFGIVFGPLFGSGSRAGALAATSIGLGLMGLAYGPLGAALAHLFPTPVRYTGASLTFNLAGILGASAAPYIATWLAERHGLASVGYYLSGVGVVALLALLLIREPRD
jgi:MFS family permease